ncbi:MAG: SDR family oxidoreductase, partial [Rhodospirillales bacterium]
INNILPGAFDTDRMRANLRVNAEKAGVTEDEFREKRQASIPAGRFGEPSEFGELCAYVCSAQAGYITGQNLLIDGGNYPGTF